MISFQNDGLIDMRAVTTFGVSAKGDNKSAIGFFGTGLKYAIAVVLRNGGRVSVWRGLEEYSFSVVQEEIRGEEFGIVQISHPGREEGPRPLGFTTHLGARWEPWMAFREVYCNMLDEGGSAAGVRLAPVEGKTTVWVSGFAAFEDAYGDRAKIILESAPTYTGAGVEFHRGESGFVHYRAVRAGELPKVGAWTYNLVGAHQLTEDRTFRWPHMISDAVVGAVLGCTNREFLEEWLTAGRGTWEHELNLNNHGAEPSEVFLDVAQELSMLINVGHNKSATEVLAKHRAVSGVYREVSLSEVELDQLNEARRLLGRMGYATLDQYPVKIVESLGGSVQGMALIKERTILLSHRVFNIGTRYVTSTLLEEYLHLALGFQDESRDFQNYLLDALIAKSEQLYKEEVIV